jgi:DNA-binding NarL/FixJ family response regulator
MRGRVLVADDHPIVRDAVGAAIRSTWPDFAVDEAETVAEAEAALRARKPFVLCVVDLGLPDANGFSGVLLLQKLAPDARMVVLSAREDAQAVSTAFILDASAYLTKSTPMSQIAESLKRVLAGERVFPTGAAAAPAGGGPSEMRRKLASLSPAQTRILLALADGRLNKQIAADMELTEATVKAHLTAIFRKLGVSNRTQAILAARPLLGAGE